ncbi:EAL domain-containing protein [Levilactobacillus suantsaii]|uniref:EAL domain-containing protein n=1 Tax=Levilactobacillus suantsaii TaxID=2292255 RepID=A0A4Q0VI97_9LACO|nr:EAL domain-containing protein [Levilactobacillus suantsaii]QMU08702.1 EAL domain-containing protein [Levilactobacillus suantsaii]RXI76587.1 EAL domain-containing protein [Levilactobacillus suantsaii]
MYRFFVQPQVNTMTQRLMGYELLLRAHQQDYWVTPTDFTAIPIDQQMTLSYQEIVRILRDHQDHPAISLNLNRQQFTNDLTIGNLIGLTKAVPGLDLTIELTEAPQLTELQRFVAIYRAFGIHLSLDDVGTDNPWGTRTQEIMPFMDSIKFALQNFRAQNRQADLLASLKTWRKIADIYHLDLIVEGVESKQDELLAQKYNAAMTQGYYYSKPVPYVENVD